MRLRNILIVGLCVVLTGCSPKTDNTNEVIQKVEDYTNRDIVTEDVSLTIYLEEGSYYFTNTLGSYATANPNVNLNIEIFNDPLEMSNRITTESMSGKGPDIFLFHYLSNSLDVQKMMQNGAFYNLTDIIASDSDFDSNNYHKSMIEAGRYDNNQFILPFSFNLPYFVGEEEVIKKSFPELITNDYNMSELLAMWSKSEEELSHETDHTTLFTGQLRRKDKLNMFLELGNIKVVDYKNKEVILESTLFEDIATGYRNMYSNQDKSNKIAQKYGKTFNQVVTHYRFIGEDFSIFSSIRQLSSMYQLTIGKPISFITLPTYEESEAYTAYISNYGGVNSNTKYPKAAYEVLRYLMDYETNGKYARGNEKEMDLSVNRKHVSSVLKEVGKTNGDPLKIGQITPLDEKHVEELQYIMDRIQYAVIPNPKVGSIIENSMKDYMENEEEFEEAYNKLCNQLKLYLNE